MQPEPTTKKKIAWGVSGKANATEQAAGNTAAHGKMPDYKDDEWQWTERTKQMMKGRLKKRQIFNKYTQDRIIEVALLAANELGVMGNFRATWKCFRKAEKAHDKTKRDTAEAKEYLADQAKLEGLTDAEFKRVMAHTCHGGIENNIDYYMALIRKFAQKTPDQRKAETQSYLDDQKPYTAPPITNPFKKTPEQLAEIERKGKEAQVKLQQSNGKSVAESEADAHFGPKHSEQSKPWSAINAKPGFAQRQSAWQHFKRELIIIDPKANCGVELKKALPKGIDTTIAENGIVATCDLLEKHLHSIKERQPMTDQSPAIAEITPEQWAAFLEAHNWTKRPFVLPALNAYSVEHQEGPVERLGQWAFDLDTAEIAINAFLDAANKEAASKEQDIAQKATSQGDNQPSAPAQPPAQEQASQPPVVDEPAIDGEVVETPKPAMALVPNTGIAALPAVAQWDIMKQQAGYLLASGFLPQSIKNEAQVITIMMMGSALQVDPIVALNNINVIAGKPTVAPQLMLALVRRSGQLESFKVTDDGQCCTVEIKRKSEPTHIEKFSQQDAIAMGLAGKDNWKKQAPVMRKWRCIAAACRTVFSDIIWGIASYTAEEIDPDIVVDYAA